eukprot:GHVU01161542.1.p2 GENE.GHVU01161542.1~~GHVU01161542.1.p2  ORF type:complete len:105 (-),score=3.74 GHVU01161542.1:64-378(-)
MHQPATCASMFHSFIHSLTKCIALGYASEGNPYPFLRSRSVYRSSERGGRQDFRSCTDKEPRNVAQYYAHQYYAHNTVHAHIHGHAHFAKWQVKNWQSGGGVTR